jgi:hypothetical protein
MKKIIAVGALGLILAAGAPSMRASVVIESVDFSLIETSFIPRLETPLSRLDLIPAAPGDQAPVANLGPRSAALGSSLIPAGPRAKSRSVGDSFFEASALSTVALNFADYFSTREALRYPGLQEGNPLMKGVVKSPAAFAAVKIGISAVSYLSLKAIYKRNKTLGWVASTLTNLALSYVVSNNVRMISQARAR